MISKVRVQTLRDRLVPTSQQDVEGCIVVAENYNGLVRAYRKKHEEDLKIPPLLVKDFCRVRTLVARFKSGDFRWSMTELKSLQDFAQWTVDVNCKLRGQEPKTVQW